MASPAESAAMRRALDLAAGGFDPTSPNPVVGAVVLSAAGEVVGEGATRPRGGAHAEVVALDAAGARAGGGTLVVTLEPCHHTGRTGPCSGAIRAAGIGRVVYAVADPNTRAAGGAVALAAAGLEVEGGLLAVDAAAGMGRWLAAMRAGRPFVTWKYAATLDGRSAAADGTSRWVTGAQARAEVQLMRARHDAVLVGVGTVLADDPQLTARLLPASAPPARQPLRVVLDSDGRTPAGARVRDGAARTLVLGRADVPSTDAGLDLAAVLKLLHDRGERSLLVEGGPRVAASFLAADLVDRVVGYLAPALLGAGATAVADLGIGTIAGARRLRVEDVTRVGEDVRITAAPAGER